MEELIRFIEERLLTLSSEDVAFGVSVLNRVDGFVDIEVIQNDDVSEEVIIQTFIRAYYEYRLIHGTRVSYHIMVMEDDGEPCTIIIFRIPQN